MSTRKHREDVYEERAEKNFSMELPCESGIIFGHILIKKNGFPERY